MELRIAVCDDAEEDRAYVSGLAKDWATQAGHRAEITAFSSAESFLFRYAEDKNWDILLLDIEMGAMDGVRLAKRVRRDNEAVQIVFVTGYSDYIAEGYEVAALHYLMKPVSRDKLFAVLNRAVPESGAGRGDGADSFLRYPVSGCSAELCDDSCKGGVHRQAEPERV